MQDLTLLTDEEFETLRASVMSEQVKRNRMREIPEEVRALKSQFESFGGTAEQLVDKINEPAPEPQASNDIKDTSEPS